MKSLLLFASAGALSLLLASCPNLPVADSDGDGVPDVIDQCPAVPGPPDNLGCPVVEGTPYDCDNPPAVAGFVAVRDPIKDRYIVKLKSTGAALNVSSFAALSTFASRFQGVSSVQPLVSVRSFAATVKTDNLRAILGDPNVQAVIQESRRKLVELSWGQDRVDQRDLPLDGQFNPAGDGAGVHVIVSDTGVTKTADLGDRLSSQCYSTIVFRGCDDGHGHGTHVAGTAAGTTWGIAKQATVHSLRFLDENGSGSDTDALRTFDKAIEWAKADPSQRWVINMSWGGSATPAIDDGVCKLRAAGILPVAAAGNEESNSYDSSPSRVLQALTVGATERNDSRAYFSNWGPGVDLFAPGVDIISDTPTGGTTAMSGTSMASPHVTGAAAVYRGLHPAATPDEVHDGIVMQATDGKVSDPRGSTTRLLYVGR